MAAPSIDLREYLRDQGISAMVKQRGDELHVMPDFAKDIDKIPEMWDDLFVVIRVGHNPKGAKRRANK